MLLRYTIMRKLIVYRKLLICNKERKKSHPLENCALLDSSPPPLWISVALREAGRGYGYYLELHNIRIWRHPLATLATSIKPSLLNLTRFSIIREVHVLEKKFQNKFTQQAHFPAATFLQKYICLHSLTCDQAGYSSLVLSKAFADFFSPEKKRKRLITVYRFLGYLPRKQQLLCGFELMN